MAPLTTLRERESPIHRAWSRRYGWRNNWRPILRRSRGAFSSIEKENREHSVAHAKPKIRVRPRLDVFTNECRGSRIIFHLNHSLVNFLRSGYTSDLFFDEICCVYLKAVCVSKIGKAGRVRPARDKTKVSSQASEN